MKVTQFETTPSFFLRPYELKPTGGRMGGEDVIEVRDTPNRQKFTGFGVAVTGSSCYNLNLMPEDERKAFLDDIYSDSGLGLSVCRLSVASSDYSAELYSYDDENADTSLEHFSVEFRVVNNQNFLSVHSRSTAAGSLSLPLFTGI